MTISASYFLTEGSRILSPNPPHLQITSRKFEFLSFMQGHSTSQHFTSDISFPPSKPYSMLNWALDGMNERMEGGGVELSLTNPCISVKFLLGALFLSQ